MTARPPYPVPTLSPRQQAHVERALRSEGPETPRKNRLYADAFTAWLRGNHSTFDSLGGLLSVMLFDKDELDAADDAQLRLAYGIAVRA